MTFAFRFASYSSITPSPQKPNRTTRGRNAAARYSPAESRVAFPVARRSGDSSVQRGQCCAELYSCTFRPQPARRPWQRKPHQQLSIRLRAERMVNNDCNSRYRQSVTLNKSPLRALTTIHSHKLLYVLDKSITFA